MFLVSFVPSCTVGSDLTLEYFKDNEARLVAVSAPAATAASAPATTRPAVFDSTELPLIITRPVILRTPGSEYLLNREGLYRLYRTGPDGKRDVVRQTILYTGDVWRFAGHLSRLYVYGTRHGNRTQTEWDEMARTGVSLSLQCGNIARFVCNHLTAQSVRSRLVSCVASRNWNGFDDGHALMEVYDPAAKRFILFDPTLGARFLHNGRPLDLLEVTQRYRAGKRADTIKFIRAGSKIDPLMDYEAFVAKGFSDPAQRAKHLGSILSVLRGDVESIHRWYGRVMNIPLIDNGFTVETTEEEALVRTLPEWRDYKRLSFDEFRRRFYGSPIAEP